MCEYCDRVNLGILSSHNEVSLDTKGTEAEGVFKLYDEHNKYVADFHFPACPMCRKPLGELGKRVFGDLRPFVVNGYVKVGKTIKTVCSTHQIRTPLDAKQAVANLFSRLIANYEPEYMNMDLQFASPPVYMDFNSSKHRDPRVSEDNPNFELWIEDKLVIENELIGEYTLKNKKTGSEYVLCINRLEL